MPKKYEIKYHEGIHRNMTEVVEGNTMHGALMLFFQEHPNADYESVKEVRKE